MHSKRKRQNMTSYNWFVWFAAFCLLTVCDGCGKPATTYQPVAGSVTFQGKPLEHGTITFLTADGPAGGALIRFGRYELPAAHGLKPGKYRVAISSLLPSKEITPEEYMRGVASTAKDLLPAQYNAKTTLTADVTPKKNQFDFDIHLK